MWPVWIASIAAGLVVAVVVFGFGWRWASQRWSLPCPTSLGWVLENPILERIGGTRLTLERMDIRAGQRVLEIGPGPGRLLLPAAELVLPGGEVVGIEIQQGMAARLRARAKKANVENLTVILGDATEPHVAEGSFDLAILCTVLGEIPDREAALAQCYRALKSGGRLSVTELFGDPHYQSRSTVKRLAERAGFRLEAVLGRWWLFTANFIKPEHGNE